MEQKVILQYNQLAQLCEAHRTLGRKLVCTIGSWDMLHIGHLRYLHKAREFGDILIVGTDSDRGIKTYKNPLRPIIPQEERMEMLSYQSCVGYVTLVDDVDEQGQWQLGLVKAIHPHIFIAERTSYTPDQMAQLKQYCEEIVVLDRQAKTTSTTRIIEQIVKRRLEKMLTEMSM